MPSVVSPAQVQTANGANMYVPIDGDVALLPPIIEGTPITSEKIGFPPFISSIRGIEPITINENTYINYTSSIVSSITSVEPSVSSFLSTFTIPANALTVNGPVRFSYNTDPANSLIKALNITGDMEFNTVSANILEALKIFNIPITKKLYATSVENYGLASINVFDMGGLRFAFGTTNDGIYNPGQGDPNFILRFNDFPANTFPNQTQTGLFVGKCNCIANLLNYAGQVEPFSVILYSANTVLEPGNVILYTDLVISAPTSPGSFGVYTYFAIGVAKT
jgi:hypothetical protein